jgi:hypothetical protein
MVQSGQPQYGCLDGEEPAVQADDPQELDQ